MKVLYGSKRDSANSLDKYLGTGLWVKVVYGPLNVLWYVRLLSKFYMGRTLYYRVTAIHLKDIQDLMYSEILCGLNDVVSIRADCIELYQPVDTYTNEEFLELLRGG